MPTPVGTYAARRAWAIARLGHSRQDATGRDWTPRTDVDDCALFMSSVVFGARSYACWNVDGFKSIGGGTYHRGAAGLRAGDVVLFDWDGNGIGNHTEMAEGGPDAAGNFNTIGANGRGTIAVAFRAQTTRYVLGYFRPSWPASPASPPPAPAAGTTKPDTTTEENDDMAQIITADKKGQMLAVGGSVFKLNKSDEVRTLNANPVPIVKVHPDTYDRISKHALG